MVSISTISISLQGLSEALKAYFGQFEKLDSGSRLNRPSDGAAQLAISSFLRGEIASVKQGFLNLNEAVSLLQTAEGSLGKISEKLQRMLELTTQAQSGTLSPAQIQILQGEFDNLSQEIAQISQTAEYNGIPLHQQKQTFFLSAAGREIPIQLEAINLFQGDVESPACIEALRSFIEFIRNYRSRLAATLNSVEGLSDYLNKLLEEATHSESRISDTDYAQEILDLSSSQIAAHIESIGIQNHLSAQAVLSLLQER
ncbi:MAG TPA: hypothetical protein PK054_08560 [Anaerohalosphaeraceae bacterium]|nr:hypothetical protein [Anaerohalosphaeraceae bacterium]HOL89081.1 hypothetical protein [Anaerohalosphaeraceae bacterium]HPP56621.1 hypothetical protein [Anaerohalosphaeraceae bacterium]